MQLSNYSAFPTDIPIIIEDEIFLYPFMIAPIFIGDSQNKSAADYAIENNELVLIVTNKIGQEGSRDEQSFYEVGVIGSIMRKVSLPDGRVKLLFQGLAKGKVLNIISKAPLVAQVESIKNEYVRTPQIDAILQILREKIVAYSNINQQFPADILRTIDENHDPNRVVDLISSSLRLKKDISYELYLEGDIQKRVMLLIDVISKEIENIKLQKEIRKKVHSKIEKVNKEYFLKEQLKQIQKELGTDNQREEEIAEYLKKLEELKPNMPEDAHKEIKKQLDKLSRMHPESADANLLQNYVEWALEIPFGKFSKKNLAIEAVEKQLDSDHYSLEKPKERIVEYFAVRELLHLRGKDTKDLRGTILCFIGPPGVGKTSLANSIAKALKRSLVRIALGGLEDVSELRGHRRTYIGAMPGRIVQGLIDAKELNPVIVLDEIDKIGRSFRGDPSAVLLEILDPEQNSAFRDYYLNFNLDLSSIIFIATANDISTIPSPLRDRMEFITVSSYTPQEKLQIAKKYLIPQEMKKHGLKSSEISLNQVAIKELIDRHTRESGVRNLRRKIAQILRKCAKKILKESPNQKIIISSKNLKEYVDKAYFDIDEAEKSSIIGVANGLAWTSVGGDVLKVEAIKIKGKGALVLTGSLGDVMKESARIAYSAIKTQIDAKTLKIDSKIIPKTQKEREDNIAPNISEIYNRFDLHIHVPEGATPKDGPSAGITMATVIASILSEKRVRADVAMTGELTLIGKVLPIGGLKEKLIAAHRAKIKKVLIPKKNYDRDLDDIPKEVLAEIEVVPLLTIEDVLKEALE